MSSLVSSVTLYNEMGSEMREITQRTPAVHVYSFETPRATHGEASRLIAKLRVLFVSLLTLVPLLRFIGDTRQA